MRLSAAPTLCSSTVPQFAVLAAPGVRTPLPLASDTH
jgi:hypothetical protein